MEFRALMITHRRVRPVLLFTLPMCLSALVQAPHGKGKPSITLRANPAVAFAPARVVVTAEISGGADDFQDFYCAKVEWTWADGTTSEAQDDCDPYVAGTSTIRRRFTSEHKYELPGQYEAHFSLKQGKRTVGAAGIVIRVRHTVSGR